MQIQLHREGVILVDMMRAYLMSAWKGDDVLKSREHLRVKSNQGLVCRVLLKFLRGGFGGQAVGKRWRDSIAAGGS